MGDSKLFEVRTVLGEIPDQSISAVETETETPGEGRVNWLLSSVAQQVPDIARRHQWSLKHVVNKQSLPVVSESWPTTRDQCQLVLIAWSNKLSLGLKFRHDDAPGLRELLEERHEEWREVFSADFAEPLRPTVYTSLGYEMLLPEVGDTTALADVIERTEKMAEAMVPLLDEYFAHHETGGT